MSIVSITGSKRALGGAETYRIVLIQAPQSIHKATDDATTLEAFKVEYQKKSRDNARTPMQWDSSPNAGFTTDSQPWMRVNDNYKDINAASQTSDPDSVYHCWRQVLDQRKAHKDIFVYGDFAMVDEPNDKIFAYKRLAASGDSALIVCNFSTDGVSWKTTETPKEVLVSPTGKTIKDFDGGEVYLSPCEAVAVLL